MAAFDVRHLHRGRSGFVNSESAAAWFFPAFQTRCRGGDVSAIYNVAGNNPEIDISSDGPQCPRSQCDLDFAPDGASDRVDIAPRCCCLQIR